MANPICLSKKQKGIQAIAVSNFLALLYRCLKSDPSWTTLFRGMVESVTDVYEPFKVI